MFGIKELDVQQLQELTAEQPAIHLLDVRSPEEVAQGAIPGAVNIPLHLLPVRISEIPTDKTTVIYCRSGARSAQACAFLQARGNGNVFNLRGGIIAWAQHGMALS